MDTSSNLEPPEQGGDHGRAAFLVTPGMTFGEVVALMAKAEGREPSAKLDSDPSQQPAELAKFSVPRDVQRQHVYILGRTGSGKSTLLAQHALLRFETLETPPGLWQFHQGAPRGG